MFTNANGIPVQRAAQPSAAAINALPRRLALTTLFITIPVSLTSNLFGITSSLIVSSPIPQIRDAARKIRLNDVYADQDGFKTYHQPRSPRGPSYEFVVPPLFLSDPAVLLANNSPRTYKVRCEEQSRARSRQDHPLTPPSPPLPPSQVHPIRYKVPAQQRKDPFKVDNPLRTVALRSEQCGSHQVQFRSGSSSGHSGPPRCSQKRDRGGEDPRGAKR